MTASPPPWLTRSRTAWYEEVHSWLAEAARAGERGAVEEVTTVKERPWSVVLRVRFQKGTFYFKPAAPAGTMSPRCSGIWRTDGATCSRTARSTSRGCSPVGMRNPGLAGSR